MRQKSLAVSVVIGAVFVGFANVGARCNEEVEQGRVGAECNRDPDRADTTYGFLGRVGTNGCAEGFRCFAEVGEIRGRCSVFGNECAPGAPPYPGGYYLGPSLDCAGGLVCEMRGAPPLQRAYYGRCIQPPPPDAGPPGAPVTLTCGSPVPDTFTHVDGRAVDYEIKDCDLEIGKAVRIQPGTVIALGAGRSIKVGKSGSLNAVGTASARIVLRAIQGGARWGSVVFFNKAPANELAFVDFAFGGAKLPEGQAAVIVGAGSFAGGDVSIRDCVFGGSEGDDISVGEGGDLRSLSRSAFTSAGFPISLTPHQVDRVASDNDIRSGKKAINVRSDGSPVARDVVWAKLSVPYHLTGDIELRGSHTISKGVTILMGNDANLRVGASAVQTEVGKLVMTGTTTERISVKGEEGASSGSWGGILVQTASANSFSFVTFNGGGGPAALGDPKGMVSLDPNLAGTAVTIRDCVFEASKGWGVVVAGQTANADIETANTFSNNTLGGVSP